MKTALVTGASSGIGLEFARILSRNNYRLILVARNMQKLSDLPENTIYINQDLSDIGAAKTIHNKIQEDKIDVDVLINNAGFGDYANFTEADVVKLGNMIELNVRCLTELAYFFGQEMKLRSSGNILNVASTAAFFPGPKMAVYYGTKHYVLSFSEAIAAELAPFGVKVTCLCPGPTASNFQKTSDMQKSKLIRGRKLPTAHEVAEFGYDAMLRGKVVAVHGLRSKIYIQLPRLLPRSLVRRLVSRSQ